MKRFLSCLASLMVLILCFCACEENPTAEVTPTPPSKNVTATPSASAQKTPIPTAPGVTTIPTAIPTGESPLPSDPNASPVPGTPLAPTPIVPRTPTPTPKPTPVPTPTPTIRPAQTKSIVPPALLTVGYTTPLEQPPAGYKMPYYIEVDLPNQCVNVYVSDGKAYNILLNRFIISGGSSSMPSKEGRFYIKTDAQQKAATGQKLKYYSYYFQKWESYAYYITRYCDAYMFHSFTFQNSGGYIKPKSSAYYNMGNRGSAGCLRMLMSHAKWIYDNVDPGTLVYVTSKFKSNSTLRSTLKQYVPPLNYDMTPEWTPGEKSKGLVQIEECVHPQKANNIKQPTPSPKPTAEPVTPTPTAVPATPTPTAVPATPTATANVTPTVTPTAVPVTPTPTNTPEETPKDN